MRGTVDLSGRTALVVGATAGIGRAVGARLAAAGAATVLAGRDLTKLRETRAEIALTATGPLRVEQVDLADLGSVRRAAAAIGAASPVLDIVVANASVMLPGKERVFTVDGFETTFAVNHLGNAALLLGLEDFIRASRDARVVIVASEAHRRARGLPLDDLMGERGFDGMRAYARSKLANILFARRLAELWTGTTVYAAHPGGVLTDMMRTTFAQNTALRLLFPLIKSRLLSPRQAADGLFRIATDPALREPSGTYFELGRPDTPGKLANDREIGRKLFERTVDMIASADRALKP